MINEVDLFNDYRLDDFCVCFLLPLDRISERGIVISFPPCFHSSAGVQLAFIYHHTTVLSFHLIAHIDGNIFPSLLAMPRSQQNLSREERRRARNRVSYHCKGSQLPSENAFATT